MASGVFRPVGHASGRPRGVAAQSVSRMRRAMSLSPGKTWASVRLLSSDM